MPEWQRCPCRREYSQRRAYRSDTPQGRQRDRVTLSASKMHPNGARCARFRREAAPAGAHSEGDVASSVAPPAMSRDSSRMRRHTNVSPARPDSHLQGRCEAHRSRRDRTLYRQQSPPSRQPPRRAMLAEAAGVLASYQRHSGPRLSSGIDCAGTRSYLSSSGRNRGCV